MMRPTAIAIALVSATTLGLANTSHAMSLPSQSALKAAVPSHTTEVYWRRGWGWGPGIGIGIAAGAITAAALASRPWGGGYWGGYPGYAYPPAYGYGYGYAPAYSTGYGYAPAYSTGYDYAPAYSYGEPVYGYGPAYSYSSGTTYVRPGVSYAYGRVGPRAAYAKTWGSGVRSSTIGSRSTVRVVNRRR
jgi:hypothetical protein